jgi:hypothetical protein
MTVFQLQTNTQPLQRPKSIRHQPFTASLVDRGLRAIGNYHPEALLARGNGRCQARRSAADYEYIS